MSTKQFVSCGSQANLDANPRILVARFDHLVVRLPNFWIFVDSMIEAMQKYYLRSTQFEIITDQDENKCLRVLVYAIPERVM